MVLAAATHASEERAKAFRYGPLDVSRGVYAQMQMSGRAQLAPHRPKANPGTQQGLGIFARKLGVCSTDVHHFEVRLDTLDEGSTKR